MEKAQKPLVSVIVPIYGVEAYLTSCVESLLAQTYPAVEIVLVDDGSPDGCPAIVDEYAARESRVCALHQKNGGLSAARNAGISASKGEWVAFVDPDDLVSPVFIETLMNAVFDTGADMAAVPCGSSFLDGSAPSIDLALEGEGAMRCVKMSCQDYLKALLYQAVETNMQSRLCRRELFANVAFPEGVLYEDLATAYRLVHAANAVALVKNERLYAYRLRRDGIIRSGYTPVKRESMVQVVQALERDIAAWYPDLVPACVSRSFSGLRMVYAQVPRQLEQERSALWGELCSRGPIVVADPQARRRERLAARIALFGQPLFDLFCWSCRRVGLMR